MPTKKKKKKIKKSSTSKTQRRGLKNYNGLGFIENPYALAAKVKDWKELQEFISIHAPALGPAGVAYASVKYVLDNYNELKISYECPDAVFLQQQQLKHCLFFQLVYQKLNFQ